MALPWLNHPLIAILAGVLYPFGFAPFNLKFLSLISLALLFRAGLQLTANPLFRYSYLYGLGVFGFGSSWVYISFMNFGGINQTLAIAITLLFVLLMALFTALGLWLVKRAFGQHALLWVLPAIFVSMELLRSMFLGGFSWLNLGVISLHTPFDEVLAGFGVHGGSLLLALFAMWLAAISLKRRLINSFSMSLAFIALMLVAMKYLMPVWTYASGEPKTVSLIQGNIEQKEKWKPSQLLPTLQLYNNLTAQHWESDIIIWPETAVPAFKHRVDEGFLKPLSVAAIKNKSTVILGIPDKNLQTGDYYNAILVLGEDQGHYYKHHLVPFGEFLPLKPLLQPLLDFLKIPMSNFSAGDYEASTVSVKGHVAGFSICYEDAYGREISRSFPEAEFLINISNDAWFGDSLAPHQHLQMAQVRARETQRYLLRATNTGISAVIDPFGELLITSEQFKQQVISHEFTPVKGLTPYLLWGEWPLLLIPLSLIVLWFFWFRKPVAHDF